MLAVAMASVHLRNHAILMVMQRFLCVGGVASDGPGRVLLVQRRNPPDAGAWTIPGGRVEAGESAEAAVVREMLEETGLQVRVGRLLARLDVPGPDAEIVYDITDYAVTITGGTLQAGDDATAAGWFRRDELAAMRLTPDLLDWLDRYGVF
ncbi:MAG TPA: NUDIX hydrolase [Mycobacteriales bacterium]|nr:NUDIX hydrolase [Mycobacteriales bacterium]